MLLGRHLDAVMARATDADGAVAQGFEEVGEHEVADEPGGADQHGEADDDPHQALAQLDQVIHQRRAAGFDFVDGGRRRRRQGAADGGRSSRGDGGGLLRLELVLAADEIVFGHQAGVSCFTGQAEAAG